ncbi:hypothetical protein SAMN04488040_1760 [Sulfitobacter marinus]|uniref:Uncharacterized protein n=1 Tax=Sulfitobacter marinus TaxID=394264 RepID=A0A1I6S723_9RHOB|nr:hypothetical protein SAMN04488040_1760 [Sulfitobacter marinus]
MSLHFLSACILRKFCFDSATRDGKRNVTNRNEHLIEQLCFVPLTFPSRS